MSDLPDPLVAAEVNLRDFAFMPLDVVRLRDSDIAAVVSAEAFRAAVLLWCASWHQSPASSLPSDDVSLARLAGFGRDVLSWSAVKEEALRGFVLCRDGRLYHGVVAEKANTAWAAKQSQKAKTEAATAARKAQAEARQRDADRNVDRDDDRHVAPDGALDVHQEKGREGRESKKETREGASQPEAKPQSSRQHVFPADAFERWWAGYPHKVGRGAAEKAFAKVRANDAVAYAALVEAVQRYRRDKPADREWCNPATWLNQMRWLDEPSGIGTASNVVAADDGQARIDFGGGVRWPEATVRSAVKRWRDDPATWPADRIGPPPGHDGCRVPERLVRMVA